MLQACGTSLGRVQASSPGVRQVSRGQPRTRTTAPVMVANYTQRGDPTRQVLEERSAVALPVGLAGSHQASAQGLLSLALLLPG